MPANLPDLTHGIKQVAVGLSPNDGLGDDLRTAFIKVNYNSNIAASFLKEKVLSSKSFYVSTSGNDNNPGTVTSPFRTITRAFDAVKQLNFNGLKATVYVKAGTYTEQLYLTNSLDSASSLESEVILTNYNNDEVLLELPSNASTLINVSYNARLNITNIIFKSSNNPLTNSTFIYSDSGVVELNNVEFRQLTDGCHISLINAKLLIQSSYSITGSATTHLKLSDYSKVSSPANRALLFSSPSFTSLVEAYNYSIIDFSNLSFSGTPTGKRFTVDALSKIVLPNTFPSSLSAGEYITENKLPSIVFNGSSNNFNGSATFNNTVSFNGNTTFNNITNFLGAASFANASSTATLLTVDNTNKVATCDFVQRVASATLGTVVQIPVGAIIPYSGSSAPSGWLLADGSEYLITNYPALFAVIGSIYGGNGVTTFRVPDLRGRTPIGLGQGTSLTNRTLGQSGGAESVALAVNELASHGHTITDSGHTHTITDSGHTHTITDPGHNHAVTDPGHNHVINDPGHVHGVSDPGHVHGVSDPGHSHALYVWVSDGGESDSDNFGFEPSAIAGNKEGTLGYRTGNSVGVQLVQSGGTGIGINNNASNVSINASSTGLSVNNRVTSISVNNGTTNLAVNNGTTGATVNNGATNITVNNSGSGAAHNNMQPWLCINFLIKT